MATITEFDRQEAHRWQAALDEAGRATLAKLVAEARDFASNNWRPVVEGQPENGVFVIGAGNGINMRIVQRTATGDWREPNGSPSRPPLVWQPTPVAWVDPKVG